MGDYCFVGTAYALLLLVKLFALRVRLITIVFVNDKRIATSVTVTVV